MSLLQNVSGQYLYFTLVSALSGNSVAGSSGSISGRKSLDGLSGQIVLSGNIIELGGGGYRANLYDFDTNGKNAGYFFTASGCVPVNFSMVTMGGMSGAIYPNSGLATGVLSGAQVALFSGQSVNVFSGQISGQLVNAASGVNAIVPPTTLSGVVANSGLFTTVLPVNLSGVFGTANINSGQLVNVFSGQLSGFQVNLLSGNQTQVWSGTQVNVFSGQLSGQGVTLTSGMSYTASGIFGVVSLASGTAFLASGQAVSLNSGQIVGLYSGQSVNVFSGQLSGQQTTLTSGQSYTASGIFGVVSLASGTTFLASGQAVSLNSGQSVNIFSGQLSGQQVTPTSGATYFASGQVTLPASGFLYLASGVIFPHTFSSGTGTQFLPEAIFKANFSGITGEAERSLLNAARKLVNKWDLGSTLSGYLSVFKENDSTVAYTQAISSTSGASPVTGLDT